MTFDRMRDTAFGLMAVVFLTALDQYTKCLAAKHLIGHPVDILPGVFRLQYLENTGAAFGLFNNQMAFFYVITIVFLSVALMAYLRVPHVRKYLPVRIIAVFLMAGALGNFIDRVSLRYVRDFLYFCLIDFPIFNVADIYVTCSAFAVFYLVLFFYKEEDLNALEMAIKGKDREERS